ncbi:MAG: LysM peptidoglycan-binding domain-containing protein [Bifidobacteriaceae bacterium]|nr:LysM peptidoglycan-binding domain-containing protein [Bifidobacteriaceae bacterium]
MAAALVAFALLGGAFRMGAATAGERYVPTRPVVVTAGDSLWSIAADSAGPGQDIQALVVRLARINHLSGSHLEVGDVLEVPLE